MTSRADHSRKLPQDLVERRRELGARGERQAATWYESRGYVVLEKNWRCRDGELDLILGSQNLVVFCEVKTRSSAAFGTPAAAVTRAKQRRIRHLAMRWLDESPSRYARLRFDVVSILAGDLEVVEDAF